MTILFCPLFLDEPGRLDRNLKWLKYYTDLKKNGLFKFDQILMVDNASKASQLNELKNRYPEVKILTNDVRLEKLTEHGYSYWYRAQRQAVYHALAKSAFVVRLIHLDSDVFVLSKRLLEFLNNCPYGWHSMWSEMYDFAEVNIQVIYGLDYLNQALEFYSHGFLEYYPTDVAERRIPFSHIHKEFIGDRYSEKNLAIPSNADYIAQTPAEEGLLFQG